LGFDRAEQPVALQWVAAAGASRRGCAGGEDHGYREINLNVGCPFRPGPGRPFGACLMAEPELVGDLVAAMKAAVKIPVTVKCRIGIDDQDDDSDFECFVITVQKAAARPSIVHAPQGLAQGPVSQGEPRSAAPQPRARPRN